MSLSTPQMVDVDLIETAQIELVNRYLCLASLTVCELRNFKSEHCSNTITLIFQNIHIQVNIWDILINLENERKLIAKYDFNLPTLMYLFSR